MYVHYNGRIIDIWRRINGLNSEFYIPNDFEVSSDDLIDICNKASTYRGLSGEYRKVYIEEYDSKDSDDPDFNQCTAYYAIYDIGLNNAKKLYRHFLVFSNDTIIEVFDSINFSTNNTKIKR